MGAYYLTEYIDRDGQVREYKSASHSTKHRELVKTKKGVTYRCETMGSSFLGPFMDLIDGDSAAVDAARKAARRRR